VALRISGEGSTPPPPRYNNPRFYFACGWIWRLLRSVFDWPRLTAQPRQIFYTERSKMGCTLFSINDLAASRTKPELKTSQDRREKMFVVHSAEYATAHPSNSEVVGECDGAGGLFPVSYTTQCDEVRSRVFRLAEGPIRYSKRRCRPTSRVS
jgi:hypothetical protein